MIVNLRVLLGGVLVLLATTTPAAASPPRPAGRDVPSPSPSPSPSPGGSVFLQKELPLRVVLAIPAELLQDLPPPGSNTSTTIAPVVVRMKQAFTVVFSRPVIALGSDFGVAGGVPAALAPFTVSGPVPGALRWVTTIARWDISESVGEWPTDVEGTFTWNTGMKAFDGVPLQLPPGAARSVQLTSEPISFRVAGIESTSANAATDGEWSAYKGMKGDDFPEVPPDGNVTLHFTNPVRLSMLPGALQVKACCGNDAGARQKIKVFPCYEPFVAPNPFAPPEQQQEQQRIGADTSTCAVVRLEPGLPPGKAANLILPVGARYSNATGPAHSSTNTYLWGLRRFRIPLRSNFKQLSNDSDEITDSDSVLRYRRWTLWLPHGLAAGITAARLAKQVSLCAYANPYSWWSPCKPVEYTLERSGKAQLLMTVPGLMPRQHFHLAVKGDSSIKDAYGLPLESSETFFFSGDTDSGLAAPELASGSEIFLLEPPTGGASAAQLKWPYVYRGKPRYNGGPYGAAVWEVPPGKIPSGLYFLNSDNATAVRLALGAPSSSFTRVNTTLAQMRELPLPRGIALVAMRTNRTADDGNSTIEGVTATRLVVQSDLQYAAVGVNHRLTHFVTTTQGTAAPLAGAKVSTFVPSDGDVSAGPVCWTDASGTCTVDTRDFGTLSAAVEAPGHGALPVWRIPAARGSNYEPTDRYAASLALDRLMVMPGEELHLAGFLQRRVASDGDSSLQLPSAGLKAVEVQVMPAFTDDPDAEPLRLPAKVDAAFGTITVTLSVPAKARPGEYSVDLLAPSNLTSNDAGDGLVSVASQGFAVGTPRPPTAVLNASAPDWVPPTAAVPLLLQAQSYVGASIGGAVLTVRWSLPAASGAFDVTSNATGGAAVVIDLGALPPANATRPGDILSVSVSAIGPTREPLSAKAAVRISNGPVRVELVRSPTTDLPGVPFIVSAQTWLNDRDGTALEGVTVVATLAPASPGDDLANCTAAQRAAVAAQRCTVVSGRAVDPARCTLTLPCAADLKLVACPTTFANGSAVRGAPGLAASAAGGCSETPIGRTAEAWRGNPWSTHPPLVLLKDRANHTVGSSATLSYVNAYYRTASGVLVWGSGRAQRSRPLGDVAPGPHAIALPLGPECVGGCVAAVVLSLPRVLPGSAAFKAAGAAMAPLSALGMPRLFDPLAPATTTASVTINVFDSNRLNVTIRVRPSGGDSGSYGGLISTTAEGPGGARVPILQPSASAEIEVLVADAAAAVGSKSAAAAGAEVVVMVVDEAILALAPYPLPDPAADLLPARTLESFIKEINDFRTSRAAVNATFSTLARRLALDPWLPLVTSVSASASVSMPAWGDATSYPVTPPADVGDAEYLRGFTSSPTSSAHYGWGLSQRYPAGSRGSGGDAGAALRLSSQFKTTPLFATAVAGADGRAVVRLTAPPNLSAFTVRAFAVSKGKLGAASKYGSNETQLIVRQPLSLVPSLPAAVRFSDDFEAGVIVSAPDAAAPIEVELTATVEAPVFDETAAAAPPAKKGVAASPKTAAPAAAAPPGAVTAAASGADAIALVPAGAGPATVRLTITPRQQQVEARFRYSAKAIGAAGLRFAARITNAGDGVVADRLQDNVRVLPPQSPVTLATSFALSTAGGGSGGSGGGGGAAPASAPAAREEALQLPAAAPGSGTVTLLAGTGFLPAIEAIYQAQLFPSAAAAAAEAEAAAAAIRSGPDGVNAALLPAFLARYHLPAPTLAGVGLGGRRSSSGAPALLPASLASSVQLTFSAAAATTVADNLTDPSLGLLWWLPREWPMFPSVFLNSWAVWLLDAAQGRVPPFNSNTSQRQPWAEAAVGTARALQLGKASKIWREVAARQLVANAADARAHDNVYGDWGELAWARLALGPTWAPPKGTPDDVAGDLALPRQLAAALEPGQTSISLAACTGLTLLAVARDGKNASGGVTPAAARSAAVKLVAQLTALVRVSGREAYLARAPGAARAASREDQALAVAFLAAAPAAGGASELLPKLAAYVAGGGIGSGAAAAASLSSVFGTSAGTIAVALTSYDEQRGSIRPDAQLTVTAVGGVSGNRTTRLMDGAAPAAAPASAKLLSASFTPATAGAIANASSAFASLPGPQPRLEFSVAGTAGELSVAATLSFTPAKLLPFATYRGLSVERIVAQESGAGRLAAAALGDTVSISVQLTTPDDLGAVVVEALMPAGLEPLDPNAGGLNAVIECSGYGCPTAETQRTAVTFRFGGLGAGTVTLLFKAIAVTPGRFALPPSQR